MKNRIHKIAGVLAAITLFLTIPLSAVAAMPEEPRVGVHDPSIIKDKNGDYYIFGSHIAWAKSNDLISWSYLFEQEYEGLLSSSGSYLDSFDNALYGDITETLAETFEWAGYDDADCAGGFAIWAPDVFWNEDYVWTDENGNATGETGAYMLYYSASSTWRRSAIGFVVSTELEGPYTYGGTVIYSGFSEIDSTDGSDRNIKYDNTNIDELIADGTISGINEEWFTAGGRTYNTRYAPNAIDPCFITDDDGSLWMAYGSWSGGIFMLEVDKKTGMVLYPGEDGTTEGGQHIDRYFGIRVAGGYGQSGEGPYIVHDEDSGYYYLFLTYGGLQADGGYNMRQFRSENATGPYLDAQGQEATWAASDDNQDYGVRVMANYQFENMDTAYLSPGHNSAFQDDDGQWYLIYHTRFSDNRWHEVRVHQMFVNKDGWLVTTPYEYAGDKMTGSYSQSEVLGEYEFIINQTSYGPSVEPTVRVTLQSDGTLAGDETGSWTFDENNGVTLTLDSRDGTTYNGVFFRQTDESGVMRMTFSAIGSNNESVWGSSVAESTAGFDFVSFASEHYLWIIAGAVVILFLIVLLLLLLKRRGRRTTLHE